MSLFLSHRPPAAPVIPTRRGFSANSEQGGEGGGRAWQGGLCLDFSPCSPLVWLCWGRPTPLQDALVFLVETSKTTMSTCSEKPLAKGSGPTWGVARLVSSPGWCELLGQPLCLPHWGTLMTPLARESGRMSSQASCLGATEELAFLSLPGCFKGLAAGLGRVLG